MKSTYALILSTLLALPVAAQAAGQSGYGSMSYSYGDARLIVVEPDVGDNADGIRLDGSFMFQPQLYAVAAVTRYGDNNYDITMLEGGVGYRQALRSGMDLVAQGGLVLAEIDVGPFSDDDTGLFLRGGLRGVATPQIEYGAYAEYRSIFDDGDVTLTGEGLLHFTHNLAMVASLGLSDDFNTLTLGVRWSFAR